MKFGPLRISFERKSLASPTVDDFNIFAPFGLASPLSVPAVANAVALRSEGPATLDIAVIDRATGAKVEHPIFALLTGDFNPWTSAAEGIRKICVMRDLHDVGGVAIVVRNSERKPVEVIVYDAGRVSVEYATDGSGEPIYRLNGRELDPRDVIHVPNTLGRAPVSLARGAINAAAAMETHARKTFESGARPGAVVQVPKGMGEDAIGRMRSSFRTAYEGAANAGKTAFIYDGVTFTQAQISSVDAQFLELRRFQTEEIARSFSMSASMLGDLTRSSYSNQEQKAKEFLSYTLEPILVALESAFNRVLLSDDDRAKLAIRFDRDDLSRVDLATRALAINSLVASTVLSPNQGASWIGMPPHEGGDTFENRNITVKPVPVSGAPKVPVNE